MTGTPPDHSQPTPSASEPTRAQIPSQFYKCSEHEREVKLPNGTIRGGAR